MIVADLRVSACRKLANEQPRQYREEVANVVGHDCQHAVKSCQPGYSKRETIPRDIQQISNTCSRCEQSSSGQIGADSPGHRLNLSPRRHHYLNLLFNASNSERGLLVLLLCSQSLAGLCLSVAIAPRGLRDSNVSSVCGFVVPLELENMTVCEHGSVEYR